MGFFFCFLGVFFLDTLLHVQFDLDGFGILCVVRIKRPTKTTHWCLNNVLSVKG